ncbi:MAG: PH domain-containing protein [Jatrophihabitans sp.]|uniref:PH domain-containing protein n=1 Tax=Jatrophihabitans sp. TaxID=1932789 RepID=UPI003F7E9FF5
MPPLLRSELPIRARTRHSPITWFRRTSRETAVVLALTLVAGWLFLSGWWAVLLVALELLAILAFRIHTWSAEWIILTGKRIIRIQGVPETTTAEASLRIDRVSGARLVQTVPGKWFGYGTIELEAPGDHPDTHNLTRINDAVGFFMILRELIFGEPQPPDPDDHPADHITEPLPAVPDPERVRRLQRAARPPKRL